MWDRSIKLPLSAKEVRDKDGFAKSEHVFMDNIPANRLDVTRNDVILASQSGFNADVIFEIMACNYSGQSLLVDETDGTEYDVKRTFRKDKSNTILLTCERRERGG